MSVSFLWCKPFSPSPVNAAAPRTVVANTYTDGPATSGLPETLAVAHSVGHAVANVLSQRRVQDQRQSEL